MEAQKFVRIADLSAETRRRIGRLRWDRIIEKHEGPADWRYLLEHDHVEFLTIEGYEVLLPVEKENHANITIRRVIPSADGQVLTIFLTDTTWFEGIFAGFMAVCERVPGEDWYIALLYHEWFVTDDLATQYGSLST